jgi:HD-like signal output (HDOD) protein
MRQIPKEYGEVIKVTETGVFFNDAEQDKFGFAHPLIGALVAKKWNFSLETCQVILHHHDPIPSSIEDDIQEKTILVQLADSIAHNLGYGHTDGYPDSQPRAETLSKLFSMEEGALEKVQEETREMFDEMGSVFM